MTERTGDDDTGDDSTRDDRRSDELFPEQTSDDTDRGWGEHPDDEDDDERLIREKPPHW